MVRRGMVRRGVVLGVAAAAVAVLAGCMTPPPPPTPATEEEIAAFQEQQAREWWESFAPGIPMPDVEVIEAVPAEESNERQLQCLNDAAIPGVTVSDDGGVSYEGQGGFEDPLFMQVQQQFWICSEQFPVAGEAAYVMSQSELAWLHDFYAQRYRPCLASLGFDVVDFPTREQFIGEGAGYPRWVPFEYSLSPLPTQTQWHLIAERCPLPPLLDGYVLPGYGATG